MMDLPFSPAAERNRQPILDILKTKLPAQGMVLEIASGSGQHVVFFADALPSLTWQPTDFSEDAVRATTLRSQRVGLTNVLPALELDVTRDPWPVTTADAVLCSNMIHISPWEATLGLFRGASAALSTGSHLLLYGPFSLGGKHTSASNAAFDASLKSRDASWGVRDLADVTETATLVGLERTEVIEMPANNLMVCFTRMD